MGLNTSEQKNVFDTLAAQLKSARELPNTEEVAKQVKMLTPEQRQALRFIYASFRD